MAEIQNRLRSLKFKHKQDGSLRAPVLPSSKATSKVILSVLVMTTNKPLEDVRKLPVLNKTLQIK